MIRAIIFDCFGVLTTDLWGEFCNKLSPGPAVEKAHELNHQYDSAQITFEDFVQGVASATGCQPAEVIGVMNSTQRLKNIKLFNYIRQLHQNYKIGLLSNVGSNWIREEFLTLDEQKLFDGMIFSFEVGFIKPDPRMFQLAAKELSVKPEECVMIDDKERYCEAARSLGMQAIYYQNFNQFKKDLEKILTANSNH